jgi:hypothetical protein
MYCNGPPPSSVQICQMIDGTAARHGVLPQLEFIAQNFIKEEWQKFKARGGVYYQVRILFFGEKMLTLQVFRIWRMCRLVPAQRATILRFSRQWDLAANKPKKRWQRARATSRGPSPIRSSRRARQSLLLLIRFFVCLQKKQQMWFKGWFLVDHSFCGGSRAQETFFCCGRLSRAAGGLDGVSHLSTGFAERVLSALRLRPHVRSADAQARSLQKANKRKRQRERNKQCLVN